MGLGDLIDNLSTPLSRQYYWEGFVQFNREFVEDISDIVRGRPPRHQPELDDTEEPPVAEDVAKVDESKKQGKQASKRKKKKKSKKKGKHYE